MWMGRCGWESDEKVWMEGGGRCEEERSKCIHLINYRGFAKRIGRPF